MDKHDDGSGLSPNGPDVRGYDQDLERSTSVGWRHNSPKSPTSEVPGVGSGVSRADPDSCPSRMCYGAGPRPKICFLDHSGTMPRRKRELLEQEFDVTCIGVDWSYGHVKAALGLRGHDVIIAQTAYHSIVAMLWAPRTPVVVENHGDLGLRNRWLRWIGLRHAKVYRAVSQWTAGQFPDDKMTVTFPPWVDRELFTHDWDAYRIRRQILYLGGVDQVHKGSEVVRHIPYPLINMSNSRPSMVAVTMAESTVVIVPSLREGFGLVALEAMFSRTPIVASNVGGLKELIKHEETGILVEPNSVRELTMAINDVWKKEKPWNTGMADRAYDFACKFWTPERYLEGHRRLVREATRT